MRVIKNYFYNISYQIFILMIPLMTTPYLARVLGPKGVGINAYTNSIIQYFILFGGIGINLYGNRQIAFVRDSRKEMTTVFWEIFSLRLVTVGISSFIFLIFLSFTTEYQIYYLAQFISLLAVALDISWFFMGIEDFGITVLRNVLVKIATLICIFTFVKTSDDLTLYILILSLSLILGNMVFFLNLFKYIDRPKLSKLILLKHFKPALLLFIPQIATQVYVVMNKTMLGSMVSIQDSGYFDLSDKIIKVVLAVVTAVGTVMLPRVANAYANGKIKKTKDYLYGSFSFVTFLSVPIVFGLAAVASEFVPLFFSKKFNNVTPIMLIETVIILLIAWSNTVGTQYLLPTNQTKAYTQSVIIGAVVNLVANIPLIMMYGAIGAAIATVLSEVAVTLIQLIALKEQVNYRKLFAECHKYFLAGLMMFLLIKILGIYLNSSWLSIFIEMIVGLSSYLILLVIFKIKLLKKVKQLFL